MCDLYLCIIYKNLFGECIDMMKVYYKNQLVLSSFEKELAKKLGRYFVCYDKGEVHFGD